VRIGRLELLRLLYQQVIIPDAVYRELTDSKRDLPPAIDLASMSWLVVAPVADQDHARALRENLDPGEAEAIVLAIEIRADLISLIGVVARAKRAGLIDQAKPVLNELIRAARFWIGPELYSEVLAELGEVPHRC